MEWGRLVLDIGGRRAPLVRALRGGHPHRGADLAAIAAVGGERRRMRGAVLDG